MLYNYSAVFGDDKVKGIAPEGWHIPSKEEWQKLADYLGGSTVAGGKMKSSTVWGESSSDYSNESGFNALPAGMYDFTEVYQW